MGNIKATSFNLPENLKQRFRVAVAERHTDQTKVVRNAIEAWLAQGSTETGKALDTSGIRPKTEAPLPDSLRGLKMTKKQLALYHKLAEKLAAVIIADNSHTLAILTGGINLAYSGLERPRPSQSAEETSAAASAPPAGATKRNPGRT